ncbi:nucleotidyltransferase domain-containing protein [Actinomycetes bacterium KLBMP 9797]
MQDEPVVAARDLVADLFPQARWALLTGSVLTPRRTPGSDLDVVVLLPDGDPAAPHRDSRYWRGWPVELFVHDAATLAHYLAKDLPGRRPTLHRMIATGVLLTGDGAHAVHLQEQCAEMLAAGPPPLADDERAAARYGLTDLLDDLTHAWDPGERTVVAATAWTAAAQQALMLGGHWVGGGKWLLRELRDMDNDLAARWLAAHGDAEAVAVFVREVLDRAGGPLFAGYHARGERPARVSVPENRW